MLEVPKKGFAWSLLIHLVQHFFMENLIAIFEGKKSFLIISDKLFKCMHQLPKVHRNCFCRTFLSTFLGQLFEVAFYLCMPLHFRIRQCNITREESIKLDRAALLIANPTKFTHPSKVPLLWSKAMMQSGLQKDGNFGNVFSANWRFWQPFLASQLQ